MAKRADKIEGFEVRPLPSGDRELVLLIRLKNQPEPVTASITLDRDNAEALRRALNRQHRAENPRTLNPRK